MNIGIAFPPHAVMASSKTFFIFLIIDYTTFLFLNVLFCSSDNPTPFEIFWFDEHENASFVYQAYTFIVAHNCIFVNTWVHCNRVRLGRAMNKLIKVTLQKFPIDFDNGVFGEQAVTPSVKTNIKDGEAAGCLLESP